MYTDNTGTLELWTPDENFWDRLDPATWQILEDESWQIEFDDPFIDA